MKNFKHQLRTKITTPIDSLITNALLKKIKKSANKKTESNVIHLFSTPRFHYHGKLYLLIAGEFCKRGHFASFLFGDPMTDIFPNLEINGSIISQSLFVEEYKVDFKSYLDLKKLEVVNSKNNSIIDFNKKEAWSHEINCFSFVECNIRSILRRYNIDYANDDIKSLAYRLLASCDVILDYYFFLLQWAKNNNRKICIYGWESIYIPNSIWAFITNQMGEGYVKYIDLNRGYMHYFGKPVNSSYITFADLTKVDNRLTITNDELQNFSSNQDYSSSITKALDYHRKHKFNKDTKDVSLKTKEKINDYRLKGKKIFVLFAHLFFDVGVNDSSPAFKDMCDWIISTINYFNGRDSLLLLKPHPAEIRSDIQKPNETLFSFVQESGLRLTDNITFLDSSLFSICELAEYISCGLIWRSSVGLELSVLGVPNIIAGKPYYRTIELNYCQSRENYFELIEDLGRCKITLYQKDMVSKYLFLLENQKHYPVSMLKSDGTWNFLIMISYLLLGNKDLSCLIKELLRQTIYKV